MPCVVARDATGDGIDEVASQLVGGKDRVDRSHRDGALDAVDRVEALGELPALLREHLVVELAAARSQAGQLRSRRGSDAPVELGDARVGASGLLDLPREHDRRRRAAADDRGTGPFERDRLHVLVQPP